MTPADRPGRVGPWLALGVALGCLVLAHDAVVGGGDPFTEGLPRLVPARLVRTAVLAASAVAVVGSLAATGTGRLTFPARCPVWVPRAAAASVALAVASGVLAVLSPSAYASLSPEDGLLEWVTALAFLAAGVVALRAAVVRRAAPAWWRRLVAAAGVLAVAAAGEEISWGQRLLGLAPPPALAALNDQGELNLHNVATDELEAVVYVGILVWLVALPLVVAMTGWGGRWPLVRALTVPWPYALAVAPLAAMNLDQWPIAPVQWAFHATVAAVVLVAIRGPRRLRLLAWATAAGTAGLQVALLLVGPRFARAWEPTEWKEAWIGAVVLGAVLLLSGERASAALRSSSPGGGPSAPRTSSRQRSR